MEGENYTTSQEALGEWSLFHSGCKQEATQGVLVQMLVAQTAMEAETVRTSEWILVSGPLILCLKVYTQRHNY